VEQARMLAYDLMKVSVAGRSVVGTPARYATKSDKKARTKCQVANLRYDSRAGR